MSPGRAAATILAKELRAEFRTRELLNTTLIFALLVVVLFSFAFEPTSPEARRIGPGLLWIAFLFAGSLMLHPCFEREQVNDTLEALRVSPAGAFAILLGKMVANFLFLLLAELLLLPVFSVLYNVAVLPVLGRLVVVLMLGTLGLAATGTVFSAMTSQARMRELLLPLLLLPVLTPVLIACVEATSGLLAESPALDRTWVTVVAVFDAVFVTLMWLLCDALLEG